MRKIVDILVDASEGKIPTHEECYWALLALRSKLHFTYRDLEGIAKSYETGKPELLRLSVGMRASSEAKVLEDRQKFYQCEPKTWLGDSGNPFTAENQKWRDLADSILKNVLKK